jgi:2'-5' RNA ligase
MTAGPADPPAGPPRRLFVAVGLPPQAHHTIDDLLAAWRDAIPGARWSPRANRHVTLRFLGATPPELIDAVTEAVAATAADAVPFRVSLAGPGRFPARGRARVLWVGLDDPPGGLPALAADLGRRLPPAFEPEPRPFAAHVTVARCDPPAPAAGWEDGALAPTGWTVAELLLVQSHLGRPHARYEIRGRFALGNVAAGGPDPR